MLTTLALVSLAAAPPPLVSLFPQRASVEVPASAQPWFRLELSDGVLESCQPDLSDLRLLDKDNQVIAYRLFRAAPVKRAPEFVPAKVVSMGRDAKLSNQATPGRVVEQLTVEVPPLPARAERWALRVESARSEYVAQATLTTETGSSVGGGALFKVLASGAVGTDLTLPVGLASGEVTLTLTTLGVSPLNPRLTWVASFDPPEREARRFTSTVRSDSSSGHTMLTVSRPQGLQPDRLAIATTTPAFSRQVSVFDVADNGAKTLVGDATLFRLAGVIGAERVEIPLSSTRGDHLEVVLDDGDSPPLAELSVALLAERPTLVFALTNAQTNGPVWLAFGGGLARPPRFDLTALDANDTWEAGWPTATVLGSLERNPAFVARSPLQDFLRAGAEVDASRFSQRRAVVFSGPAAGLWSVPLDAEDAAFLRADFEDVRVVDASGRQWPFVLRNATVTSTVTPAAPTRDDSNSTYAVPVPGGRGWVEQVELSASTPFFSRIATVAIEDERHKRQVLTSGSVSQAPEVPAQTRIFTNTRGGTLARSLEVTVDDGAEQPLEGVKVMLSLRVPELLVLGPPGRYTVLFGAPTERRPAYDVDALGTYLFDLKPRLAELEARDANPSFQATSALLRKENTPQLLMWAALGLAVLVLGGLALKLARAEDDATKE